MTGDLIEEHSFYEEIILPTFNRLFSRLLKKKIILKRYKSNGVCGIYIFDKKFSQYLINTLKFRKGKKIDIGISKLIRNKDQKINFLRGLFDTDGSIYFGKSNFKTKKKSYFTILHYKPKIGLSTISKNLIDGVYQILKKLNFDPIYRTPKKQRPRENTMYKVELHRKEDISRWLREIGFKNPKHMSKVLIWKKFGFVPPHTTLKTRMQILNEETNILNYYPKLYHEDLLQIKRTFNR